jgi:5-methylcytosine-specific restriction endonuclease McrA
MAGSLPSVEIVCIQCGERATKFRTGGKPARYCGNACKIAAHRRSRPDRLAEYRAKEAAKYVPKVRQPTVAPLPRPKRCRDCGAVVAKGSQRCGDCRVLATAAAKKRGRVSPAHHAARRRAKAWRRAIERGAEAERFDPFEVFERDKWRCHLCGIKTPKRLRGTHEDNAPELDHIVPLAAGGEHSRRNTACSCRKCNGLKADRPLGQLRLVA